MAKVKTEIEKTASEWASPNAENIFNALLQAYPDAEGAGYRAQFWRSMMLSLAEFYPQDKPRIVEFFLNKEGINQRVRELPAKQAKAQSEYKKQPDYSATSGRDTAGECESCG